MKIIHNFKRYIPLLFSSVILFILWLVLSGHYTTLLITLGILSSITVMVSVHSMKEIYFYSERNNIGSLFRIIPYCFWLLWQILLSNISLAKSIWNIGEKIRPEIIDLDVLLETELCGVLYANSITLTPGSLTVAFVNDRVTVHLLLKSAKEDLMRKNMEYKCLTVEGTSVNKNQITGYESGV